MDVQKPVFRVRSMHRAIKWTQPRSRAQTKAHTNSCSGTTTLTVFSSAPRLFFLFIFRSHPPLPVVYSWGGLQWLMMLGGRNIRGGILLANSQVLIVIAMTSLHAQKPFATGNWPFNMSYESRLKVCLRLAECPPPPSSQDPKRSQCAYRQAWRDKYDWCAQRRQQRRRQRWRQSCWNRCNEQERLRCNDPNLVPHPLWQFAVIS